MLTKTAIETLIREHKFTDLFIEQGWDTALENDIRVTLDEKTEATSNVICEKKGFVVCHCDLGTQYMATQQQVTKIINEIKKNYYEHLLIVTSSNRVTGNEQKWCISMKVPGKQFRVITERWNEKRSIDALYSRLRGLVFPFDKENYHTLSSVIDQVKSAFGLNIEKVTRQFYNEFKKKQVKFQSYLSCMNEIEKEEFSTLMFNRLMFIYFIQKKGLLDQNVNYLRTKLYEVQQHHGKNQFDKFYKYFLKILFHHGLDMPIDKRNDSHSHLIGKVPYLNGGLFQKSSLEIKYDTIDVQDEAFLLIFDFFDKYNWCIDDRPTSTGKEINPDVLGFIFEKYISDRNKSGAYYTKPDVTNYITEVTLIPYLFESTRKGCKGAYAEKEVWNILKNNPLRYIKNGLMHGINFAGFYNSLPNEIKERLGKKVTNLSSNDDILNEPADSKYSLGKETWRDVIVRRRNYERIYKIIVNGKIDSIDGMIRYNLDLSLFVLDALSSTNDIEFIEQFFCALAGVTPSWATDSVPKEKRGVSILDPTCGSGAFLFAAYNVLFPLYETCIDRMTEHVTHESNRTDTYSYKVFETIKDFESPGHWIRKYIILENLFGVDIMFGATETTKLRLFLKLAAEIDFNENHSNYGIEPLPDIDFNVRTGNALVGFTNLRELEKLKKQGLTLDSDVIDDIIAKSNDVSVKYKEFKDCQYSRNNNLIIAKANLSKVLEELTRKLDDYYQMVYGNSEKGKGDWSTDILPFHWFANFYEIIETNKGFDVVIGNPPYVEKYRLPYKLDKYESRDCNNIYAHVLEQATLIGKDNIGAIVQLPLICSDRMKDIQNILQNYRITITSYDDRPGKLFNDIHHCQVCIVILDGKFNPDKHEIEVTTSKLNRWHTSQREMLFDNLVMLKHDRCSKYSGCIPKYGNSMDFNINTLIHECKSEFGNFLSGSCMVYLYDAPQYWVRAMNFEPFFERVKDGLKEASHYKKLRFSCQKHADIAIAVLNSSLYYWYFVIHSDVRNIKSRNLFRFPIDFSILADCHHATLDNLVQELMENYQSNRELVEEYNKKSGLLRYHKYFPKKAKSIIDEIDDILGKYYNLDGSEVEYIKNFDIIYRMGSFTR